MNDILMGLFLLGMLFCLFSLIRAIRRMAGGNSRRVQYCRQVAAMFVMLVFFLVPPGRTLLFKMCTIFMESKKLAVFREAVFSRRNYQLQYVYICFLTANVFLLFIGWLILRLLAVVETDKEHEIYPFHTLAPKKMFLHAPWLLAELCYEKKEEKLSLKAWAAVLGKWFANLSDAMLVLFGIQIAAGAVALFIKIPFLQGKEGGELVGAWYFIWATCWLFFLEVGSFLQYCPQEKQKQRQEKESEIDADTRQLLYLLSRGGSVQVTKEWKQEWLIVFLYECFQRRRRVVIVCAEESQKQEWESWLSEQGKNIYDSIGLIRVGTSVTMQNKQEADVILVTLKEFVRLELERVFPFWYQETGTVILADTHAILAETGRETDVFFSLWNTKHRKVQYLFLGCSGSSQEKQALDYYAGCEVAMYGEPDFSKKDFVLWCLDSPKGRMRRMFLAMAREEGVSEDWIYEQQRLFGMQKEEEQQNHHQQTEHFLVNAWKIVFPQYPIQNLYDIFFYQEKKDDMKSKWTIRLTDARAERMLYHAEFSSDQMPETKDMIEEAEEKQKNTDYVYPAQLGDTAGIGQQQQMRIFLDLICHVSEMIPLLTEAEQEKKRLLLYQGQVQFQKKGRFLFPEIGGSTDFERESYEILEEKEPVCCEVTILRLAFPAKEAGSAPILSALFAVVCNQVLAEIFPYHEGKIYACCEVVSDCCPLDVSGRSIAARCIHEENAKPFCGYVAVDFMETENWERGLTAALRRNSIGFLDSCSSWLERAQENPSGKEGQLFYYAQKQLGKNPEEFLGIRKLLELL